MGLDWTGHGTPPPTPPGTGCEPGSKVEVNPEVNPKANPEVNPKANPEANLEANPEVNPETGGVGGTPLAVTQEDCLVHDVFVKKYILKGHKTILCESNLNISMKKKSSYSHGMVDLK